MKFSSLSLLLATLVVGVSANDKCLNLETSCVSEDGTPCRQIPQKRGTAGCGTENVTIEAKWCNRTGKSKRITSESLLKLTGGAAASLNNGNPILRTVPTSTLANGECDEETWTIPINNCKQFFNYELNVKTDVNDCRGYYFGRQMKTICRTSGNVECTLGDGTKCVNYTGPILKTLKKEGCDDITCIDQTPESCRQDVIYDFKLQNRNDQKVKFDLTSPQIANSKVAWKIVGNNKSNFADCAPGETREWQEVRESVNVCRVIPSASINIRGNVLDPKTSKKDADFQFCFNFDSQKVRKFDQEDGTKYPFCQDIVDIPQPVPPPTPPPPPTPSKGKSKGGKGKGNGTGGPTDPPTEPPTCPGIAPGSPSAPRDEL